MNTQSAGFQTLSTAVLKLLIALTALLAVMLISGPRAAGAQTPAPQPPDMATVVAEQNRILGAMHDRLVAIGNSQERAAQAQTAALQVLQGMTQQQQTPKVPSAPTTPAPTAPAKPAAPAKVNGTLEAQVHELQTRLAVLEGVVQEGRSAPMPVYIGGFTHGATELTAQQKLEVGAVVGLIRKEKPAIVELIGYASYGGDADKNKELAGKRAEAVRKYINELLAAQPARVAGAAAPAPVAPVVAPADVEVYVGGKEKDGQTADFSLRLGPNGLNQAVVVKLVMP